MPASRALAIAATLAAVVLGADRIARLATRAPEQLETAASVRAADTVHVVRFLFVDTTAAAVSVVGDFNQWTAGVAPLHATEVPGVWAVSLVLPPGRHEYAFIVDGTRWLADPLAELVSDDVDTQSSVLTVGDVGRRS